jgi:hypothetical protein
MQPGIGAVTCAALSAMSPTNAWVMGFMDLRNPPPPMYGISGPTAPLWNPPAYHHPDWTAERLGSVYGLAIDRDGDVYVAAHGLYPKNWWITYYHRYGAIGGGSNSLAAAGTIYRINRTNGVPTVFAVLPQQPMTLTPGWVSGPGLGNVAYDELNDQFFATSLEDGKIYRLSNAGVTNQIFDPLAPDTGAPGLPPASDRIWGIGVAGGAVYYAVWNTGDLANPGKIRRLKLVGPALDPSSDAEVLTVPGLSWVDSGGSPVTDITFSADGTRMVLGQRTMRQFGTPPVPEGYNHHSRVYLASLSGTNWTVINTLPTGNNATTGEAYGGVAYGQESGLPEQVVWMTSADTATWAGPHGLQGLRPADFPPAGFPYLVTNSFRVPFDPSFTTAGPDNKGSGGDVEIMRVRDCARLEVREVPCPDKPDQPYAVTVQLQNLSGQTAAYGWWNPCPTNDLPPGAVTIQPQPAGVFTLPGGPLTNLGLATLNLQLPAGLGGQTVCFLLTLLDDTGRICCTQKVCVELPVCDCARLVDEKIECKPLPDGSVSYTVTYTLQNLTHLSASPFPFYQASFVPPAGFGPATLTPTPIPPGGTGTLSFTYVGSPGRLCFTLGLHDQDIEPCCFIPVCLDLPACGPDHPDTCALETRIACRAGPPGTPLGLGTAVINYTLCNNGPAPKTYVWNITGLPAAPPCTQTFLPSDFSPASGSVTVPAGGCVTVPITITCREWKPGDCAKFTVCASADPAGVAALCCEGEVFRPAGAGPVVTPLPGEPPVVKPGETGRLRLTVDNPTDAALDAAVMFMDAGGLLTFAPADGRAPAAPGDPRSAATGPVTGERQLVVPVRLPAQQGVTVEVTVSRFGDGARDPHAAEVLVFTRPELFTPAEVFGSSPDLVLPVVRTPAAAEVVVEAPRILSLRLEPGAPDRAVLRLTAQAGVRYRLERAAAAQGPWSAAASVPESHGPTGEFVAAGDEATCVVPCEPGEAAVFFRVVALP